MSKKSELSKDLAIIDAVPGVLTSTAEALHIKTLVGREALRVALANVILIDRKQQDYGSGNIAKFGEFGCIVRMSDKFERVVNLMKHRRGKPVNESILDSYRDFSNYGILATLVALGLWPRE